MVVPKLIHHIWFQGGKIPKKYTLAKRCGEINRCRVMLWTSEKIEGLLDNYPHYRELYRRLPLLIQKIDLAKYIILHHYGGLYVDLDVFCIKNVQPLLDRFPNLEILCGLLPYTNFQNNLIISLTQRMTNFYAFNRPLINNGIIVAAPRTGFFRFLISHIRNSLSKNTRYSYLNRDLYVMVTTGPAIFSWCIYQYQQKYPNATVVVPSKYIEPCIETNACDLSHAYFTHIHQRSWGTGLFQNIVKAIVLWNQHKKYILLIILLALTTWYISVRKK